jgi:hypothetical protein
MLKVSTLIETCVGAAGRHGWTAAGEGLGVRTTSDAAREIDATIRANAIAGFGPIRAVTGTTLYL